MVGVLLLVCFFNCLGVWGLFVCFCVVLLLLLLLLVFLFVCLFFVWFFGCCFFVFVFVFCFFFLGGGVFNTQGGCPMSYHYTVKAVSLSRNLRGLACQSFVHQLYCQAKQKQNKNT